MARQAHWAEVYAGQHMIQAGVLATKRHKKHKDDPGVQGVGSVVL